MKANTMCAICCEHPAQNLGTTNQFCGLCKQMVGRSPLESLIDVTNHFYQIMIDPEISLKVKEFISTKTITAVR